MRSEDFLSLASARHTRISLANLHYDPQRRQLTCGDQLVELEPKGRDLLELLLRQVGKPISSEDLIRKLWGNEHISRNVVTNRIGALRTALNEALDGVDASKLIVTYPRQGYLIDNALVTLEENGSQTAESKDIVTTPHSLDDQIDAPDLAPPPRVPKKQLGWQIGLLAGLLVGSLCGYLLLPERSSESSIGTKNYSQLRPGQAVTVMPVSLLLGEFQIQNAELESLRYQIKAFVLDLVLNTPALDLKNQDAPGYFLQSLEDSASWPGHAVRGEADWRLDAHLQTNDGETMLSWQLSNAHSGKVMYRAHYEMPEGLTTARQQEIREGLLSVLSLPDSVYIPTRVDSPLLEAGISLSPAQLAQTTLTELEASVWARRLVRTWPASSPNLGAAISTLKLQFGQPTDELGIWLAILLALDGQEQAAAQLLDANIRRRSFDNSLIHLLRSDLHRRLGDERGFRQAYLRSLGALHEGLDSELLFARLANAETAASCLAPWANWFASALPTPEPWVQRLQVYCEAIEKSFPR